MLSDVAPTVHALLGKFELGSVEDVFLMNSKMTFEARDEFERKSVAEKVIVLLKSEIQVSPMLIDGSWGTGKTEFCMKLISLIENEHKEKFRVVYVDAFAADHVGEPLMTLVAAVLRLLPEQDKVSLVKKAVPVIRFLAKAGVKAGLGWVLKQNAEELGTDLSAELKKAGDQVVDHTVESMLAEHVKAEESIKSLKEALRKVSCKSPVVFFVDELDRCKPDYAVSMLESIKHIFDVEGVQFVLVANFSQLRASVNHCYGSAVGAQNYLDKFIGFRFVLPDVVRKDSVSVRYARKLLSESSSLAALFCEGSDYDVLVELLIVHNHLSLREVETLVRYMEVYQVLAKDHGGLSGESNVGYGLLKVLGIFIFCFKPELSSELLRGEINAGQIVSLMGKKRLFDIMSDDYPELVDAVVAVVVLEAKSGTEGFLPITHEAEKRWRTEFTERFANHQRRGPRINAMVDVLRILRLGV